MNQISEADYDKLSTTARLSRARAVETGAAWNPRITYGNTDFARRVAVKADPAKAAALEKAKRRA